MKNKLPVDQLDDAFAKTERIMVPATPAMKQTLVCIANHHRVSVAQIVRQAIFYYTETKYPEFSETYTNKADILLSRESK